MGTIVEEEMLKVRLASVKRRAGQAGGHRRAEPGRTGGMVPQPACRSATHSCFAGEVLRFEGLDEFGALATRTVGSEPMIPSYQGGKFPLSTYLAERVREMLSSPAKWKTLPLQVRDWLAMQR